MKEVKAVQDTLISQDTHIKFLKSYSDPNPEFDNLQTRFRCWEVNQDASKNSYQAIMFIADAFEKKKRGNNLSYMLTAWLVTTSITIIFTKQRRTRQGEKALFFTVITPQLQQVATSALCS